MMPYIMRFNEHTSADFNVILYDYEKYSGGESHRESTAVAGRLGEIVSEPSYKSNLIVEVTFSIFKKFKPKIDKIKEWLSGKGRLSFSDEPEYFYKVLAIDYGSIEREMRRFGKLTVKFTCVPFKFRNDGQMPYSDIRQNPYSESRPIYVITGEGMCTLTVNGKTMTANIGQNITINTELMCAYREDGEIQNTAVTGDYENLYLVPGDNEISVTDGFNLEIIPNWGYNV